MKSVKKVLKWVDINLEPMLMMLLFIVFTTLVVIQVILRFGFGKGLSWAEEIGAYLFVWSVFITMSYLFRANKHVCIDFLVNMFPETLRKSLSVVFDVLSLVMLAAFFYGSYINVVNTAAFGDRAVALPISLNYLYASALVGCVFSFVRVIQVIFWKVRRFGASYELFLNVGMLYSYATEICMITDGFKDELKHQQKPEILQEEATYKKFLDLDN